MGGQHDLELLLDSCSLKLQGGRGKIEDACLVSHHTNPLSSLSSPRGVMSFRGAYQEGKGKYKAVFKV